MDKARETKPLRTVTVTGSQSVAGPDGHVAIVLYTKEAGPIAFEVDQRAIDALRREIAAAETFLRQPKGHA
jgi:ribosomal protein L25 (general stress protein Ctc)